MSHPAYKPLALCTKAKVAKGAGIQFCIVGSLTIKGADNGLYGEDSAQNPYSTGFPVEYTYIPQEIWWNIAMKIKIHKSIPLLYMTADYIVHNSKLYKTKDQLKPKNLQSLLVLSHVYIFHTRGYWCAQTVRVPVFSVLLCPLLAYTESITKVENSSTTSLLPL